MNKEVITIDKEAFESLVYSEVIKLQKIQFDLCTEDYAYLSEITKTRYKGKDVVIIPQNSWKLYDDIVNKCFLDLSLARSLIRKMQPVFDEYIDEYTQKHTFDFDDFLRMQQITYTADEFERVRDRFLDHCSAQLNNDER